MFDPALATLTNYPKKFKDTYWGSIREPISKFPKIIDNRNAFVLKYDIDKLLSSECYGSHCTMNAYPRIFDHWEPYKTVNSEAVAIFSTYKNYSDVFDLHQFIKVDGLYSPRNYTYLRFFPSLKELKIFVNNIIV